MPLSNSAIFTLGERFPVFARLPQNLALRIASEAEYRRVPAGKVVFDEHAPCRGLPLILGGSLRVYQRGANGREIELYRVKGGESCLLSVSCLLGKTSYTATALAEEPLAMVLLPPATFFVLLDESPQFRHCMFAEFGGRLGALMQVVEAVVFQRLDQRLAARLLSRGGEQLRLTHQTLADELGSVREIVTRLLSTFEDRGWIELGRGRVVIRDREALEHLAAT